jgi:hypothetical protein
MLELKSISLLINTNVMHSHVFYKPDDRECSQPSLLPTIAPGPVVALAVVALVAPLETQKTSQ